MNFTSVAKWSFISTSLFSFFVAAKPPADFSPFTFSVSRVTTGNADVGNDGNELQRDQWITNFKVKYPLSKKWIIGADFGYDYLDYDWKSPSGEATDYAWDHINRFRAGVSVVYRPDKHWVFMLSPRLQYAYAETASASEAQSYGVVISAMHRFSSGHLFGLGVAYLNDIDEVRTVPFLAFRWQINDAWYLSNPFSVGFSGPGGAELSYLAAPDWEFGLGVSKRTNRFLIGDNENTAEIDEWVSHLRASWKWTPKITISAFAGYFFSGELELNPAGTDETIENQGGAALEARFSF
ncbi:autotransporter outer membrane beta-barrel domain-containing protein [uncultured Shewanella sp.]|uniref:autotransporter outer membrane beta-barrel domain-containing protein n=1 Tax=uncultured Shewanella sp. TaxID=173975 RepID=UPI00261A6B08|nr:autotransporter outer membrane beta-barrel domain-containing protein [uncultured Shewanella sp.]